MAVRNPNLSTQFTNFLVETYNKERDTRLAWYFKEKKSSDQTHKPKALEVFRRKIERNKHTECAIELPKIDNDARSGRKKSEPIDTLLMKANTTLEFGSEMRPVTPKTKRTLFNGFTKEGKGRHEYLHKRYQKIPEDKFQYPVLNSWEYGWRLGDVIKVAEIKKPVYGRTKIVADTFYTRNGVGKGGE